jgi:hypothetical protein
MLYFYRQEVQQLLGDLKSELFAPIFLNSYINKARLFVAGEAQCIRNYANLSYLPSITSMPFSSIVLTGNVNGIAGPLNVRMAAYLVASGQRFIRTQPWEWFFTYKLNNPNTVPGQFPDSWAQQGQGTAGTLWIAPASINMVILNLDVVCYPINLIDDTTPEAIPVPWTEAVPFWAAWYAFQQVQQHELADKMMERYKDMMERASQMSTSTVTPFIYQRKTPPTLANTLGIQAKP